MPIPILSRLTGAGGAGGAPGTVPAYGLLAARPTAASVGAGGTYFATDDWGGTEYLSTGSSWIVKWSKNQKEMTWAGEAGTTAKTFTGLDGNVDIGYELQFEWLVSANSLAWLRPNGDGSNANYATQVHGFYNGTNHHGDRYLGESGYILALAHGGQGTYRGHAEIQARAPIGTGNYRALWGSWGCVLNGGGGHYQYGSGGSWNNPTDNMTSLAIVFTAATVTGRAVLRRMIY